MKPKQKRNSTVRIITVTLLAASITIALFIVFAAVLGAIIPATTLPTLTKKTIDGAGGYQENNLNALSKVKNTILLYMTD